MAVIPNFDEANLQAICDIVDDTNTGLTGSKIGRFLQECSIPDPIPQMTERHRLYTALHQKQTADRCTNNILGFITHVINPVRPHDGPVELSSSYYTIIGNCHRPRCLCAEMIRFRDASEE